MMSHINNLPMYAGIYLYIVAREVDGEFWFWGAYNDYDKACEVAHSIKGTVFGQIV